jgi:hypothetical protein
MASKTTFVRGDRVSWMTSQGRTRGSVVRIATRAFKIKDFKVSASKADPRIVVKSDKSGEMAAHKAGALHKLEG